MTYPDTNTDESGYHAAYRYDAETMPVSIPGRHSTFSAARNRAITIRAALQSAGETGVEAWVSFSGDRPSGFPKNGVKL